MSFERVVRRLGASGNYLIFTVGDSITEGLRASNDETTYTAVFAQHLANRYLQKGVFRYDGKRYDSPDGELLPLERFDGAHVVQSGTAGKITVVRCGIGGNTAGRLLLRRSDFIGREIDGKCADLFVICVGINDSLRNDPSKYTPVKEYRKNLCLLLNEIEAGAPDADVIFMTPTYNDTGLSAESTVDAYAEAMIGVAKDRDIPVVDLHKLWMEHLTVGGECYGQGDWLCGRLGDCCHPSDLGHAEIAAEMIRCIFGE